MLFLDQLEAQDDLMFDGEALDAETKELLKISLENVIRTAEITAEKKYVKANKFTMHLLISAADILKYQKYLLELLSRLFGYNEKLIQSRFLKFQMKLV